MNENLKAQIRQSMREKDTEDLWNICSGADHEEWTEQAIDMARATLLERGVQPPEPVDEALAQDATNEEADLYHDPDRLFSVASWCTSLSWLFIALAMVLLAAVTLVLIAGLFGPFGITLNGTVLPILGLVIVSAQLAFFYLVAQALAQLIYVSMDIEENTRTPARAKMNASA